MDPHLAPPWAPRMGFTAQVREVGGKKGGVVPFLPSSLPSLSRRPMRSQRSVCSGALVLSVQPPDSGMTLPQSLSSLVCFGQSSLQKVEHQAEHQVLICYLAPRFSVCIRKEADPLCSIDHRSLLEVRQRFVCMRKEGGGFFPSIFPHMQKPVSGREKLQGPEHIAGPSQISSVAKDSPGV